MKTKASRRLVQAVAVTCELTGAQPPSPAAAVVLCDDLADYPEEQVLVALERFRREATGRMTVQAIVDRLDDGRPGPEEAWAILPRGEDQTAVWTTEMQQAWGVALPLMDDRVAGRMAFIEAYRRVVMDARRRRLSPVWQVTLGRDATGREGVLQEAVRLGRLTPEAALAYLPSDGPVAEEVRALIGPKLKLLKSEA